MNMMSSVANHVQIEWLDQKIGIVRVYEEPVNALQVEKGIPYIFFTVVQVSEEGIALFKGALGFSHTILKRIVRFAQQNTDWDMLLWERPAVGYDVLLKIRENEADGCRMIKKFHGMSASAGGQKGYAAAEQVMLSVV